MKIKNIEESGLIKGIIALNDMFLVAFSYWLAFALKYGFDIAWNFPLILQIKLVICALTIFPVSYITPPVFLQRFIYGNDILGRAFNTACLQTLLTISVFGLMPRIDMALREVSIGAFTFFTLLYLERFVFHTWLKHKRTKGRNLRYVLFVGTPQNLNEVYHTLNDHSFGFKILGIFTHCEIPDNMKLEYLGHPDSVIGYLENHHEVTDLYLVPDLAYKTENEKIFRYCEDHTIRFYALPVFMEFLSKRMKLSHLGNTMLLSVRKEPLQDFMNRFVKRTFDITVSCLFLLTAFPAIYLIVGLIIKRQSPGPILFKQKRNGLDGKEFSCLKFRSMHVNKDSDLIQATKDDPRKFRFGNFMRKTNIDEFPQFINVLKGDMSIVGPRPHMLLHTQEYSHLIRHYMIRHLVKPGITGWAQVQGFRGETKTLEEMDNRVKADIWYVENWSFWLDIRIIWRTVKNMARHNEEKAY